MLFSLGGTKNKLCRLQVKMPPAQLFTTNFESSKQTLFYAERQSSRETAIACKAGKLKAVGLIN